MLLGEQSDRSASLTGRRVLIKVRVSRHAEADNEPHAEATAATSAPPPNPLQVCGEAMCIGCAGDHHTPEARRGCFLVVVTH